ncbi:MAG: hypothetical protein ABH832_01155 [bacterium]
MSREKPGVFQHDTAGAPETNPKIIADKYIKSIPEKDKKIERPEQIKAILNALDAVREGSHVTMTKDRIGNMPACPFDESPQEKRARILKLIQNFVQDPVTTSANMDKTKYIASSDLPKSIKDAVLAIILSEGPHSAQQIFAELKKRIERDSEADITQLILSLKKDAHFISQESDNIRRSALNKFLESIYPELIKRDDVRFLQQIKALTREEKNDQQIMEKITQEAANLIGGHAFRNDARRYLGNSLNALELANGVKQGSINPTDILITPLSEEIEEFIAKDALN